MEKYSLQKYKKIQISKNLRQINTKERHAGRDGRHSALYFHVVRCSYRKASLFLRGDGKSTAEYLAE